MSERDKKLSKEEYECKLGRPISAEEFALREKMTAAAVQLLAEIQQIERELGRPVCAEELDRFEKVKAIGRIMSELGDKLRAHWEQPQPLLAFVQKLMARQGTTMPDFDALYKKKAEFDRRLLEDETK